MTSANNSGSQACNFFIPSFRINLDANWAKFTINFQLQDCLSPYSNILMAILIADSGSTKCEWSLVNNKRKKSLFTQGISPYFQNVQQIEFILNNELVPQ